MGAAPTMESGEQEFVIQLPGCRSYGPYVCSAKIDIERHVLSLAEASNLRVVDTPFRVKLPKTLGEHILVVAYPLSHRGPFDEQESIVVYGVECGLRKTLTENEIRNQLRATYPAYDDGVRCFSVYQQSEANNIEPTSTPREYMYLVLIFCSELRMMFNSILQYTLKLLFVNIFIN